MAGERARADDLRTAEGYPTAREAWYTVGVLYCAYLLAFVDRQILAYLVDPIRAQFGISDLQFSLVSGFVFVLLTSLLAIPISVLADNRRRRSLIAIGMGIWSLAALLSSRAMGLLTLGLSRCGVALGQSALVPASISQIADSFPPDRRGLALNVHAAGVHGGIGLSNFFGGWVVAAVAAMSGFTMPLIGFVAPWQIALALVAIPCAIVAVLVLTLREPRRQSRTHMPREVTLEETIAYVRSHWFVYASLIFGAAFSAIGSYGMFAWVPAVFMRLFGWSAGPVGLVFGALTLVLGTAGLVLSGVYVGTFVRRGADIVYQRLMMLAIACAIVPGAISITADSAITMWLCIAAVIFFLGMPIGLAPAALVAITPNKMRAQVIAVYAAVINVIGLGLGPVLVALLTDFVFMNDAAVARSMGIVIVVSGVLGVLLLSFSVRSYEELGRTAG